MKKLDYKAKCHWCGEVAKWRSTGLVPNKRACPVHKDVLKKFETENYKSPDFSMSEADCMTWGRL